MTKEQNYCVYCHTCPNGKVYYGATCNIKERWRQSHYKQNNTPFRDAIIEFGWKNIKHEVLYSGLTRDEALKIEDELIVEARKRGTCLNMLRSGCYKQTDEYREEHKARSNAWNETHPEEHNANNKAWREANPDYNKSYYEANKDKILARRREQRKNKK